MKTLNKHRLRRSMLFVPGANAAMVSNAFIYQADALMFDLEDSVILREKDAARRLVYHALQHPLYQEVETIVRVNALDSAYGLADLQAVVRGGGGYCASAENRQRAGRGGYGPRDCRHRSRLRAPGRQHRPAGGD